MTDKPRVVIAMPRYSGAASFSAVKSLFLDATAGVCSIVAHLSPETSLLNHCFNIAWTQALNLRNKVGATHFAMIHADVCPDGAWLDTLYGELLRLDADVVSTVIPIKTQRGLTSTAIQIADDLWGPPMPRRLTMTEVFDLPETFGPDDLEGKPILLNTGLWICDLRKPWCEKIWFESLERIATTPEGDFVAQSLPEDWLFSARLKANFDAKLFATRKVPVRHSGEAQYANDHPWGTWKTDEIYTDAVQRLESMRGEACGV